MSSTEPSADENLSSPETSTSLGSVEGTVDRLNEAPLCDHNWVDSNGDTLRFCTRCGEPRIA